VDVKQQKRQQVSFHSLVQFVGLPAINKPPTGAFFSTSQQCECEGVGRHGAKVDFVAAMSKDGDWSSFYTSCEFQLLEDGDEKFIRRPSLEAPAILTAATIGEGD